MTAFGVFLKQATGESDENIRFIEAAAKILAALLGIGCLIASSMIFGLVFTAATFAAIAGTSLLSYALHKRNQAQKAEVLKGEKLNEERVKLEEQLVALGKEYTRLQVVNHFFYAVCKKGHKKKYFQQPSKELISACLNCGSNIDRYLTDSGQVISDGKAVKPSPKTLVFPKNSVDPNHIEAGVVRPSNIRPWTNQPKNPVACPKCGCEQISADKQGFGAGKAIGGALLTGGIGLLAGFINSRAVWVTCLRCGNQWRAGE